MVYNEANIKRIQTFMRNTEKYDNVLKTNDNFCLPQFCPGAPAYNNYTQYTNSYPYFPYADKVDVLYESIRHPQQRIHTDDCAW